MDEIDHQIEQMTASLYRRRQQGEGTYTKDLLRERIVRLRCLKDQAVLLSRKLERIAQETQADEC